ncbi:recombinase family protein [Ensifer adhaerens]|uniref:recombinase family protein n=1 Tax=Ensifer adhaerens TaxID=106592 RepID=UPI001CBB05B2|nr:recombinase family protein [Ensifer adhaerens]MBZ7924372.1 recombinase family protein [Ensifer adhaerens]UAX96381.1 recombinase family protein [Ensifer adhaerens]UAY04276.1 recombinase family protein [Ensifer adhaerens]UAY12262.1 recombinase family protein [Ensifer adhaerens]
MKIGYARVSTLDQHLDLQISALKAAGCERVFHDHVSGTQRNRPGLSAALRMAKRGDTLVVWKMDRIGRSLVHMVSLINRLSVRGVRFSSLTEALDTSSPTGLLIMHVLGAFAEFEKSLIQERTRAGLAAAREKGQRLGRRPSLTEEQRAEIKEIVAAGLEVPGELAKRFAVHPRTIRRYLAQNVRGS